MAEYCKILIIDDEVIMRQGLKHMIDWEQEGFQIIGEASNGREGLAIIEKEHPHIILCDIVMPVMDGMDFSNIVQKTYPDIQIIILSSYDNFEYVKATLLSGAVDYVLKPTLNIEELLAVLNKAAGRIPGFRVTRNSEVSVEKAMERYLLGFEEHLDPLEFQGVFPHTCFRVAGFKMNKKNRKGQDVSSALFGHGESYLSRLDYVKKSMVTLQGDTVVMVLNYPVSKEDAMKQNLLELAEQFSYLAEGFFMVASQRVIALDQIRSIYKEQVLAHIEEGFYFEHVNLYLSEGTDQPVREAVKFDYNAFSRLLTEKILGEAVDMLESYVERSLFARMDEYRLKNQIKNMIFNYLEYLDRKDLETEKIRFSLFKRVDEGSHEEAFLQNFKEIALELPSYADKSSYQTDARIRLILQYIKDNYRQELDLSEIARVFSFNYHYLSAYFNQHMMESFSDYLNRVRIEEACKLLEAGNLPIASISGEVGYGDHSYFCRVFKKVTGKTPSAWRRDSL